MISSFKTNYNEIFLIAAARLLMGGEQSKLAFESFPYTASSVTYCVDVQVAGKISVKRTHDVIRVKLPQI